MSLSNMMRTVLTVLIFISTLHIPFQAIAQSDFLFKNIGLEQGLSSREVFAVEQDGEGYIWLGTSDGLNRYDGYEIKVFKHVDNDPQTLSHSCVNCLLFDHRGRLWVGTSRGLNLYQASEGSFTQTAFLKEDSMTLTEEAIRCLYEDHSGHIWVGTMNGLYRLDEEGTVQAYSLKGIDGSLNRGIVRSILEDGGGNLWIGTYDGLIRLDAKTGEIRLVGVRQIRPLVPENNLILSLMADPEQPNLIWVGSETGLHCLDIETLTYSTYTKEDSKESLSNNVIKCLLPLRKDFIIAGTDYGLNVLDKRSGTANVFLHDSYKRTSIANDVIWDVMRDRDGHYWLATNNGVSQVVYSNLDLKCHEIDSPYPGRPTPDNLVVDMAFDGNGGKYISLDNRLFYEDRSGNRTFYHFSNYSDIKMRRVLVDRQGTVWAGTSNSLWYKDKGSNDFNRIASRNLRYVNSLVEDQDGNLWVESVSGMCRITLERNEKGQIANMDFTFFSLENEGKRSVKSSFSYVDSENRVWFMSKDLILHVFSKEGKEMLRYRMNSPESGLQGSIIYAYIETPQMYILTDEGIHRYIPETGRFEQVRLRSSVDSKLTSLIQDQYGNIWGTSGAKLIRADARNHSFLFFDLSEYLYDKVLPTNALHLDSEGHIWIGGYNQYFYFTPKVNYEVSTESQVRFTDLKVLGESVKWDADPGKMPKIVLSASENTLEVCYSILDFHSPQNIQYATQLEGYDKHWRMVSGVNKVSYSNLPPGHYIFHVKAAYSDESWISESSMKIEIRHPWWFSTWAILFYCLLGGGLFFYIWKTAHTSLKLREKVRLEKVERQAQEDLIQYKIRFFTNISHELKTPLALILGPLEEMMDENSDTDSQKKLEIMHSNASRLLRMVTQVMDFNKMERGAIRLHLIEGELVGFINKIYEMFLSEAKNRNISYHFLSDWKSYVTTFDDDKLEKVLYNLLSNAFKYTFDRGTIYLHLGKFQMGEIEGVEIRVEDTGIGIPEEDQKMIFTRFYQSHNGDCNRTGTGIGLSLAKDFVDMMKGEIMVSAGQEGGTVFTVHLPLEMKNYTDMETGETEETGEEDAKCILVVDDNQEMCSFMQISLEKEYKVIFAHDGEEGLRKVRKYNPDIIISDLMMPVMDGLEFCRKVKGDESVSHIPFILLTAKDGDENVYSGLQTGADAYISKPFNMKLLKLRLENLYEGRKKMQTYLRNRLKYGNIENESENKDVFNDPFVDKVVGTIQENLSDDTLDVGSLSDIMNLPKQQLYRKVKALTSMTVVELIRSVRLEAAATKLRESNDTISEIMYSVGFSNNSYFSKCFSEQFKLSPSDYRKKYRS